MVETKDEVASKPSAPAGRGPRPTSERASERREAEARRDARPGEQPRPLMYPRCSRRDGRWAAVGARASMCTPCPATSRVPALSHCVDPAQTNGCCRARPSSARLSLCPRATHRPCTCAPVAQVPSPRACRDRIPLSTANQRPGRGSAGRRQDGDRASVDRTCRPTAVVHLVGGAKRPRRIAY